MSTVMHPAVAQIHGVESWRGRPCLVVEFLPGGTLEDRLRDGPLAPRAGGVGRRPAGRRPGGPAREGLPARGRQAQQHRLHRRGGALLRGILPRLDTRAGSRSVRLCLASISVSGNEVFHMSDELKRYQEKLGEKFGTIFHGVSYDWANGLVRLNEYRALFGDPANIEFLNTFSGPFMRDVQQVFWRDLLLHITRLTDPVASGKKENITVLGLPDFCEDHKLRARVQSFADTAEKTAESARDWRNQRISHSDLNLAIDPDAESLAPTTLASVQSVLDAVHAALDAMSFAFMDVHISNCVTTSEPQATAFLNYAQMLVTAIRYVDSLIDPAGSAPSNDTDVAANFLAKVGCKPTTDQVLQTNEIVQIFCLRQAARRFS